ncbi:MAG: hypothetical protein IKW99_05555 [Bacteroidales bacterium]|nr:hypothetical protein [Bacteroidales bacterium]
MKVSFLTALAASAILVIGCATTKSLPERFDEFVEKTEAEYKDYTDEQWSKSKEEYDSLVKEWEENMDSFSTSEKVRVMKAMGRYGAMYLEKEIAGASESLGGVLESIPETINDIIDQIDTAAIRESVDGIKNGVEGIIESIDTARLRKSIEGLTQSIDTAKLHEKLEALIKIFGGE